MNLSQESFDRLFEAPTGTFEAIEKVLANSVIKTELQEAHFLSQCAFESGKFRQLEENLNYSSRRLCEVFPTKFTKESSLEYEFKPEKIANYVYSNRLGNGDDSSGDGWRYKGRGYLQITGKNIYQSIGMQGLCIPGITWTKLQCARASEAWWIMSNMNSLCVDSTFETVQKITKKVNGGISTAQDRFRIFMKTWKAITGLDKFDIPKPF